MKKTRIVVLYGGRSGEHEVSRRSASSVLRHLDSGRYERSAVAISYEGRWFLQDTAAVLAAAEANEPLPVDAREECLVSALPGVGLFARGAKLEADIVFPVLHGTFGEDGTVQGLLECLGLPYVGASVLGSAVGMDKAVAKRLWRQEGLPVVPFVELRSSDGPYRLNEDEKLRLVKELGGLPFFVKPVCAGSSVGVHRVDEWGAFEGAVADAFRFDTRVLVETGMDAREIECSVTGNESAEAYTPGEIVPHHEFYDYEAKYLDPDGAGLEVPARLEPAKAREIRELARRAYLAASCEGFARVDFFVDRKTGAAWLNEINTIPGFTSISMFPMMCEASGLSYAKVLDRLVELGLDRHRRREKLSYRFV